MAKILVTTRWLGLSRTSEGLCSLKAVLALADAGHEVVCLTADPPPRGELMPRGEQLLDAVEFVEVEIPAPASLRGALHGKASAVHGIAAGTTREERAAEPAWDRALERVHRRTRPDVWYIRSAGWGYAPHRAAMRLAPSLGVPWIAHVHDPFPSAALPAPYRDQGAWRGRMGLRQARLILEAADVVTVPHALLGEWMVDATGAQPRTLWEVPHMGYVPEWFGMLEPGSTVAGRLAHTGLLSRQRDPSLVLQTMAALADEGADLTFRQIGKVDPKLLARPRFARAVERLTAAGRYTNSDGRLPYREAMQEAIDAAAVLILSPGRPASPFFPAKLADALSVGLPIVAIAPPRSVVHDLLGASIDLDDPAGPSAIRAALEEVAARRQVADRSRLREQVGLRSVQSRLEGAVAAVV